jgi:hypothetical protein
MALATVADYISSARQLLQDEVVPYRYSDDDIVLSLNLAISEARRVRPELFQDYFFTSLPSYSSASPSTSVDIVEEYRIAFLYYIVGHNQLADQEDTTDARTSMLLGAFRAKLTSLQA